MPYETIDIPLFAGLNTKADERAMEPPGLAVCQNAEFDETGGLQTRKPFAPILSHANNTIADIRKIVSYGDELVAFSKAKLWSYSSGDGLWTERGEHLAVSVDEKPRFVSTGEQYDADRVEKSGVIFYSWTEDTQAGTLSYVAAVDSETGAVKLSPESIKASAVRPKLLASTNRVFLVYEVSATLWVRTYDPADLSSSSEASLGLAGMVAHDAIVDPATPTQIIVAVSRGATGYNVVNFTETPAASGSTLKARAADGAIAVAFDADNGDRMCVAYSVGNSVRGDILDASFADQSINSVITAYGTTVNQIAACYDEANICRVFCSSMENTNNSQWGAQYGSVDNAGTSGTPGLLVGRCGLASRAFKHDGNVYLWVAFAQVSVGDLAAQLQNTYFLYRGDGLLIAKALFSNAGGFSASEGFLPSVQDLGSNQFAWCGLSKDVIALGAASKGYGARSPRDVSFEFDSNKARRVASIGRTLYISGGQILQYDGTNLVEVGYHAYQWDTSGLPGAAGNPNGTVNYLGSYSWPNAKGELDRSTAVTIYDAAPASQIVGITGAPLHMTRKTGNAGEVAVEFWRTIAAAPTDAPFYLVTSKDPSATGSNGYAENDPLALPMISINDNLSDADLVKRETWRESGGLVLENLAPPAASIIKETQDRLILAGIAGQPNRIAYSTLRGDGEVASFNDRLYVDLPPDGGAITAIDFLNETLIVFKETAVFALPGDGFDNNGGGQNYGPARIISSDVGAVSAEAVALTPKGLIFKSSKGWYILTQGWQVAYIGKGVADFDGDTVVATHSIPSQHQVRCLTSSRLLVWDYLEGEGQWAEWTIEGGASATIFGGVYHYSESTYGALRVLAEQSSWLSWNPPRLPLEGSHAATATSVTVTGATDWPDDGGIIFARGTSSEEVINYSRNSGDLLDLDNPLSNTHADGTSCELTAYTQCTGAQSPGSSILVDSTFSFPETGTIVISPGLAAEEFVEYTSKTSSRLYGTVTNSHANNADVYLVYAEPQGLDIETGWIKVKGMQGYGIVRRMLLLGKYSGAHDLRIRVAYDYDDTWIDDKTWTVSPATAGPLQMEHGISRPKCEAVKFRITSQSVGSNLSSVTEALDLTTMSLEMKLKGANFGRGMAAARKQ